MSPNPVIVVVAYNRKQSLQRLLQGLVSANYPYNNILLVISIDNAIDNQDVLEVANSFKWNNGEKRVVYQPENLGLRKHILKCGAYALTYGAAIILEDDLYVSPNFYHYSVAALKFSENKSYISGISLYSHQFNVHSRTNFSPLIDGYDNWYFQFASSWGQAWTKTQWQRFLDWYEKQNLLEPQNKLPENVTRWSEKSWLKYFIAYLVDTDTYFLYPRNSYTTNFSDSGTHVGKGSTTYQVPLSYGIEENLIFSNLKESNSVYDAFYENKKLYNSLNLKKDDISVDLYGKKPILVDEKFILTDKILPYKVVKTFGRSLKPHDANIIADINGDDIFLYDSHWVQKNARKFRTYRKIVYSIKSLTRREAQQVFFYLLKEGIKKRLKQLGWGR